MRKTKIYIGKNKGVDKFGFNKDARVPSILKKFFQLQRRRWYSIQSLKLNMNSSIGLACKAIYPIGYKSSLDERVAITKRFNSGGYHGGLI